VERGRHAAAAGCQRVHLIADDQSHSSAHRQHGRPRRRAAERQHPEPGAAAAATSWSSFAGDSFLLGLCRK